MDLAKFLYIFSIFFAVIGAQRQEIQLNPKYKLGWEYDLENKKIHFDVEVETTGYVGFGISPAGGMAGADIVIGGVDQNGQSYFQDYHAESNSLPIIDPVQNWFLTSEDETEGKTILKFWRNWETCDEENDIKITEDTLRIIFSFGSSDELMHHGNENRGTKSMNLLDQAQPDFDTSKYASFDIKKNMTMPSKSTTYWCTMHAHQFTAEKSHVVAFEPILENDDALRHAHHFTIYKCLTPDGENSDDLFEQWLDYEGDDCFLREHSQLPRDLCQPVIYAYGVGGSRMVFPENLGYPLGEGGKKEYFTLEIHFDNPGEVSDVIFESGVRVYYTDKPEELRPVEAGFLIMMTNLDLTHTIPGKSENFMLNAHCPPGCTRSMIEEQYHEDGLQIFNVFLHSHLTGRKMKIRHFRDYEELPWIMNDENYDFNYQQSRPLRDQINIMPNDQITLECQYNTMARENVTMGGEATTNEMCQVFIWYYPKTNLNLCQSNYQPNYEYNEYFERFGIEELSWSPEMPDPNPTIVKPDEWAGKRIEQIFNEEIDWNADFREKLQNDVVYGMHLGTCQDLESIPVPESVKKNKLTNKGNIAIKNEPNFEMSLISYPYLIGGPYQPPVSDFCQINDETTTETATETTVSQTQTTENGSGNSFQNINHIVMLSLSLILKKFF